MKILKPIIGAVKDEGHKTWVSFLTIAIATATISIILNVNYYVGALPTNFLLQQIYFMMNAMSKRTPLASFMITHP